jgi:cell division protein FtsB
MESSELESLTEEQRITRLERKVGQNRLLLSIVTLVIVIGLSVSITIGIIKVLRVDEPYAKVRELEQQQEQLQQMMANLEDMQERIALLEQNYQLSSAADIKATMVKQEQSYRQFLYGMKVGMVDLAKMVTGSRTWLEVYSEKIDEVIEGSEEREAELGLGE